MENKRWADETDSETDEKSGEIIGFEESEFKNKYSLLSPPISLIIKNISFKCPSNDDISAWINLYTNENFNIERKFKRNVFRGDAVVVVQSLESAYKLYKLSGKEYLERAIEVKVLDPILEKSKSGHRSSFSNFSQPYKAPKLKFNSFAFTNTVPKAYKPSPFGQAKPVDTHAKDLDFEANKNAEKKIRLSDIDPSVVSFKLQNNKKELKNIKRGRSGTNSFNYKK